MKKIIGFLTALLTVFLFAKPAFAEVNPITPSTNDVNRTNGWAHVDQLSQGFGTTDLQFISTQGFYSCFEYRTDGDTSQVLSENGGVNYNTNIHDDLYPYFCEKNSNETTTIHANQYVEIRMVFGAETDERFDWTKFEVIPAITTPIVTGFINPTLSCNSLTNIHSTTVDWSDSSGGVGGVIGYQYAIDYPLPGGGVGHWTTFVTASQYSGSLNEGLHSAKVRAKDGAGNYSEWSNVCSITTDWTAPEVVIDNPEDGSIVNGTVDIRGTVTDLHPHHYWLAIYSGSTLIAGPGTVNRSDSFTDESLMSWNTTLLDDGEYIIKLEARDAANNKDSGSIDWHIVTINNTPDNKDQCKMADGRHLAFLLSRIREIV